jgi:O-antigen/teichoic acid export membrane protein
LFDALTKREPGIERVIVKFSYLIFAGLLVLALVCAVLFALAFPLVFPPEYGAAKTIIFPLAIGMAFQGMYYGVVNYLFYVEATAHLSVASTAVVGLSIGTSYLLISNFGLLGAALSFVLTNAVLFLVVWYLASKAVPMPWAIWRKATR